MYKTPKIKIKEVTVEENGFEEDGCFWYSKTLIEQSKHYPVFAIPLAGIDLTNLPWGDDSKSINDFIYHFKRIENTDLKHPIILNDKGFICDGWHRVCKAILQGYTGIDAIRLEEMPQPDKITNNDNTQH